MIALPASPFSMVSRDPLCRASRRTAAAALAAELGHDLQGPANLFRMATERLARGEPLDAEDIDLWTEELERLARLNARLRELSRTAPSKSWLGPRQIIEL